MKGSSGMFLFKIVFSSIEELLFVFIDEMKWNEKLCKSNG